MAVERDAADAGRPVQRVRPKHAWLSRYGDCEASPGSGFNLALTNGGSKAIRISEGAWVSSYISLHGLDGKLQCLLKAWSADPAQIDMGQCMRAETDQRIFRQLAQFARVHGQFGSYAKRIDA